VVGRTGFGPATFCTSSRCPNQARRPAHVLLCYKFSGFDVFMGFAGFVWWRGLWVGVLWGTGILGFLEGKKRGRRWPIRVWLCCNALLKSKPAAQQYQKRRKLPKAKEVVVA
jgi:hypothetical protein